MAYYHRRLAQIHAQDYTMYARAAARVVQTHAHPGLVIDIGCGAGDLGAELDESWDYLGIDASADMLAIARSKYPHRSFQQGEATDVPPATAQAIVAIGEVMNYATDLAGVVAWARDCRAALAPGGLLLFDVAGPTRADPEPASTVTDGDDYRIKVTAVTDARRHTLTRTIEITDASGSQTEVHTLHLMDPLEVMSALRQAGFEVTALDGYDGLRFRRGWSGFLCRVILES